VCGIVGYTGSRQALPILLEGLSRLEYRGYDSAGVALLNGHKSLFLLKETGKVGEVRAAASGLSLHGTTGIGHTRWATHGRPTRANAHPHVDCHGHVAVVHNGIVENYLELKEELALQGHSFASETDSEVIPHLVEHYLAEGASLPDSVRRTARRLKGAHAIVVTATEQDGMLVAVRMGNAGGVAVGYGDGEMWLASDLPALLPYTRKVAYLSSGEMTVVGPRGVAYQDLEGRVLCKTPQTVSLNGGAVVKEPYGHFVLKEIHEQPEVLIGALRQRLFPEPPAIRLDELPFTSDEVRAFDRVVLIGMGSSLHAASIGREYIERLAQVPAEVDNSSEFRYRRLFIDRRTLVIALTQSGETADTLGAMEEARRRGARLLTLCNAVGSQATRMAEGVVYLRAGPEIGVCATKTFTASLMALYLLAMHLGLTRRCISREESLSAAREVSTLSRLVGTLLGNHEMYQELAHDLFQRNNFLYLGRGIHYPIAMEGALKLKEISYIPAEGIPAGEMKHGPIALIDENTPVVALAPQDALFEKTLNNLSEVKARGGSVIAVTTVSRERLRGRADYVITVPQVSPLLQPVLEIVPLQLLAYYIAVQRGCDVDQPRNLAKSVTVE